MKSILRAATADGDEAFARTLDAAVGGDPAMIAELIGEFEPGLSSFARRQGAADVEGVVNTTLSDAFRNLGAFRARDRRAFRAYLYRILRCRIADEFRRSYARPRTLVDLDNDLLTELVDEDASTFDERIVDQQLVDNILEQLTAEQREWSRTARPTPRLTVSTAGPAPPTSCHPTATSRAAPGRVP